MAKFTLTALLSGIFSRKVLNQNFSDIVTEFTDRVLYRDNPAGEDNSMLSDIDMDNNRIFNLPTATNNTEPATLAQLNAISPTTAPLPGNILESFTATEGQTVFTLTVTTYTPGANNISVYVDGVRQYPSAFLETSTTQVTLSEGLKAGQLVLIGVLVAETPPAASIAADVSYSNASSGLTAVNVQTAIDEVDADLDAAEAAITANTLGIGSNATAISNNADAIALNTAKVSADGSINTHSDVETTSPSNGQVLTFVSASGKWEPGASGGGGGVWVLLNSDDSVSTATLDIDWANPEDFSEIKVIFFGELSNDNKTIVSRVRQGGVVRSGGLDYSRVATTGTNQGSSVYFLTTTIGSTGSEGFSFTLRIPDPGGTVKFKHIRYEGGWEDSGGNLVRFDGVGRLKLNSDAIDGLRFEEDLGGGGTLTGEYFVYGLKKV